MFEVPRTMLTLDRRGLLLAGKHRLASTCPETGRLDIEAHLEPVLVQLSAGYMRPMDEHTVSLLKSAAKAWNRGDAGRAAHDLILVRLPDPKDDADFHERIDLVGKALATGHRPDEILKALNMGEPPWITETRTPAGQTGGGEWTNDNGQNNDGQENVTDIANRPHNPCNDADAMNFVGKYKDAAAVVASAYGVPTNYVLGLAARESAHGTSAHSAQNSFFSLQRVLPVPQEPTQADIDRIPHAKGVSPARDTKIENGKLTRSWFYTYDSFTDAAKSFLDLYGKDVRNAKNPVDFLRSLKDHGFNSKKGDFLNRAVLDQTQQRLKCAGQ